MKARFAAMLFTVLWLAGQTASANQTAVSSTPQQQVAGGGATPTAPAPSVAPPSGNPLPMASPVPAGYSLIPNGYFDQVSQTARAAIESSKANEQNLLDIVKIAGSIVGAILAVGGFIGVTEVRAITNVKKEFEETLKVSKTNLAEAEGALSDLQEMEGLLIDVAFLQNTNRSIQAHYDSGKPGLIEKARTALEEGEAFYKKADELRRKRTVSSGNATIGGVKENTEESIHAKSNFNVERVVSYIAALMGVIALRADAIDAAVEWAKRSVRHNPRKLSDRDYNLACLLAIRFAKPDPVGGKINDKQQALEIVRQGLATGTMSWTDVLDEKDFKILLPELQQPKAYAVSSALPDPDIAD
ncbi:hypothetical protein SAMN05192549_105160 [Duganella sacchari]|uniref:Uncharacterized protein n=1 Tax=Duganella sacchari TaxID=551987 RepID=A0A1M7PK52_9BURK|nr:hypothetical protein [Duganella sacchari]SHN17540.1 hypothetical protein SAMN05192549_105160 [Duganella sacchari]